MDDEYNQESNIENYPYYDYGLLMNGLNAEDDMQTKEEKGSFLQAPESEDQDLEPYGDYLKDSDLDSFFREQLHQGKELDSSLFDEELSNVAEDNHDDDTGRIVKPIIHYKETFISGDSYNKKLLDQDALSTVVCSIIFDVDIVINVLDVSSSLSHTECFVYIFYSSH